MFRRCVEKLSVLSSGHSRKELSVCFWSQRCIFLFTDSWYIKLTRWQANAMGAAMFVSYPTAPLCKTQHDWVTASQHPLRFQKCGSAFQNVMNISTLSNALVNIREELWLADSDIPRLRKKCSGQAGLPGSLPPRVLRPWLERMRWWMPVAKPAGLW